MTANSPAKDGPPMFPDWLAQARRARPAAPPEPDDARTLAAEVLHLCTLCEDLLSLVAPEDAAARPQARALPERLAAVRACAFEIRGLPAAPAEADDPYSLSALGRWVWRED